MKRRTMFSSLVLLLFLWMSASSVYAISTRVTTLPSGSLQDVRRAEVLEGTWIRNGSGRRFLMEDGTYVTNQWFKNGTKIYYTDIKGNPVTGFVSYNNNIYFLRENNGSLLRGWLQDTWYFRANGRRAKSAVKIKGEYYYFHPETGRKQTGWITFKGKKYYFDPETGRKVRSKWVRGSDGKLRYADDKGCMATNTWITIGKKKYYVDANGRRVKGEQYIGGKWYFFKKSGLYDPTKKVTVDIDPKKPMIALTFDDGPGPYTMELLQCLKANNARATFFMVGTSVPNYKSTIRQMLAQHCELGNHSYNHPAMSTLSDSAISDQFRRTSDLIADACGARPTVARLPYGDGHANSRVLQAAGLPSIYWSVDTNDWQHTGDSGATVSAALGSARNGAIILMHDIHRASVTAAKTIIPSLKNRGYQLVTVTELAKYKGKRSLSTGTTYYSFY